jgi:hypothetical protein
MHFSSIYPFHFTIHGLLYMDTFLDYNFDLHLLYEHMIMTKKIYATTFLKIFIILIHFFSNGFIQISVGLRVMSTHASVLVDSVGPPSAEVCRTAASFP